jgi:hypothetical protein
VTVSAPELLDKFYLIRFRGLSLNADGRLQFSVVLAHKKGFMSRKVVHEVVRELLIESE